jgi:hypothetical protein
LLLDGDAGADGVEAGPLLAPSDGFGHDSQRVRALGELVGVERVGDEVSRLADIVF